MFLPPDIGAGNWKSPSILWSIRIGLSQSCTKEHLCVSLGHAIAILPRVNGEHAIAKVGSFSTDPLSICQLTDGAGESREVTAVWKGRPCFREVDSSGRFPGRARLELSLIHVLLSRATNTRFRLAL